MIEMLKTRRSIRKFKVEDVAADKIDLLLKAALLGPCSRPNRTWELIAVTDKECIYKLSSCRESSSQFLRGAAVVIVIASDPSAADTWIEDAAIAATLIQATACSIGLGSCWCQIRNRFYRECMASAEYVKEVLDIPDRYTVECMLGIGYPDEAKAGYRDEELPYHKIHYNHF